MKLSEFFDEKANKIYHDNDYDQNSFNKDAVSLKSLAYELINNCNNDILNSANIDAKNNKTELSSNHDDKINDLNMKLCDIWRSLSSNYLKSLDCEKEKFIKNAKGIMIDVLDNKADIMKNTLVDTYPANEYEIGYDGFDIPIYEKLIYPEYTYYTYADNDASSKLNNSYLGNKINVSIYKINKSKSILFNKLDSVIPDAIKTFDIMKSFVKECDPSNINEDEIAKYKNTLSECLSAYTNKMNVLLNMVLHICKVLSLYTRKSHIDYDIEKDTLDTMHSIKTINETICKLNDLVNSSINMIDNEVIKTGKTKYDLIMENASNDEVSDAATKTIKSLWKKFVSILKNFIEILKSTVRNLIMQTSIKFGAYEKYAKNMQEKLNEIPENSSATYEMTTYEWNDSLFKLIDFSKIHNIANEILGTAYDEEHMKAKLNEFENKRFTKNNIYNYTVGKCTGIKIVGSDKVDMTTIFKRKKKTIYVTKDIANTYISNIKNIDGLISGILNNAKTTLVNSEFDNLLKTAKSKMDNKNQSAIEFKYYKTRYMVISIVQTACIDVYRKKIENIWKYIVDSKTAVDGYIKEATSKKDSKVNLESANFDINTVFTLSE